MTHGNRKRRKLTPSTSEKSEPGIEDPTQNQCCLLGRLSFSHMLSLRLVLTDVADREKVQLTVGIEDPVHPRIEHARRLFKSVNKSHSFPKTTRQNCTSWLTVQSGKDVYLALLFLHVHVYKNRRDERFCDRTMVSVAAPFRTRMPRRNLRSY